MSFDYVFEPNADSQARWDQGLLDMCIGEKRSAATTSTPTFYCLLTTVLERLPSPLSSATASAALVLSLVARL